ncbi:unnamed protein product [Arabis nemorensis]|uniref:Uncharacterized protein n=1 Tax=Arabis nemorensis TaxID=586526 RepID=A0A565AYY8_9BRAS|nr:unnamed protein product [Arabis nemorensis]
MASGSVNYGLRALPLNDTSSCSVTYGSMLSGRLKTVMLYDLHTRITNFIRFETYGFEKVEPGGVLEFASNDFVRGQPELLEKIYDRYMEKTREEWDLVTKENMESIERDDRERTDKALAVELKDLMKLIVKERESRGQPLSKELEDLLQ